MPTGDILYIVSTFRRVRWILRIHQKMQRMFFCFGGSFSNDGSGVAIFIGVYFALQIGVIVFVFRFLFSIFLQYPFFVPLYDLYVASKKETYKLIATFLMINPCVIESKVYIINVTYVVNSNRLSCFIAGKQRRTITAEFHKMTLVKPLIVYLISCHTTLT